MLKITRLWFNFMEIRYEVKSLSKEVILSNGDRLW